MSIAINFNYTRILKMIIEIEREQFNQVNKQTGPYLENQNK